MFQVCLVVFAQVDLPDMSPRTRTTTGVTFTGPSLAGWFFDKKHGADTQTL